VDLASPLDQLQVENLYDDLGEFTVLQKRGNRKCLNKTTATEWEIELVRHTTWMGKRASGPSRHFLYLPNLVCGHDRGGIIVDDAHYDWVFGHYKIIVIKLVFFNY
jgi:hypothetical protein